MSVMFCKGNIMIEISTSVITQKIIQAIDEISCNVESSCCEALKNAYAKETNEASKFALEIMLNNIDIAKEQHRPVCQDTGMVIVFCEIGKEIHLSGKLLQDAIDEAVITAYANLRKSTLDPLSRQNTNTNAPAVVHVSIVEGSDLTLKIMLKGFGSENMSKVYMLNPAQGIETAMQLIIDTVKQADSNPCPPIIVGVGLGGTFEKACIMSKHALFRQIGSSNIDPQLDKLEKQLLSQINNLHIGVQGFGGGTTALGVFIESYPTHISSLPVAVNILCHCSRSTTITLKGSDYVK